MQVIEMSEGGALEKGGSIARSKTRNGVCSEGRADGFTVGRERKEGRTEKWIQSFGQSTYVSDRLIS